MSVKNVVSVCAVFLAMFFAPSADATYNWGNKKIRQVAVLKDGSVRFSVYENGESGDEFRCAGDSFWFVIEACPATNAACNAAVGRMSSLLLTAKAANRPIMMQRDDCKVTSVVMR